MWSFFVLAILVGLGTSFSSQVYHIDESFGISHQDVQSDIRNLEKVVEDVQNQLNENIAIMNKRISSIETCIQTMSKTDGGSCGKLKPEKSISSLPLAVKTPEVLTCEEGWMIYRNQCLLISDDKAIYNEAELLCANLGSHLAKIEDTQKWAFVKQHLSDSAWIGLSDHKDEGVFKLSSDDTVATFYRWADGEPNNSGGNEDCVNLFKRKSYYFNDEDCGDRHQYICEKKSAPKKVKCPEGTEYSAGFCFHISEEQGTFQDGISYCKMKGLSYAKITSKEQWAVLADRAKDNIWIGLNDIEKEGVFVWQTDGSHQQIYKNWCPDEPNDAQGEHCTLYSINWGNCWNDYLCHKNAKYVCETKQDDEKCPAGFITFQTSCYYLSEERKNYRDAQEACEEMGAYLATLSTAEENEFMRENSTGGVWFGLNDLQEEGHFKWTENDETFFPDLFKRNQPNNHGGNEDCIMLWERHDYKLNDAKCTDEFYFACSTQPTTI